VCDGDRKREQQTDMERERDDLKQRERDRKREQAGENKPMSSEMRTNDRDGVASINRLLKIIGLFCRK